MIQNFKQKFNQLPKNIQALLSLDYGRKLNIYLIDKYKLKTIDDKESLHNVVDMVFLGEIKIIDLPKFLADNFSLNLELAKKLAVDIVGLRCLSAGDFFAGQAKKFILDNGGHLEDYDRYISDTQKALKIEATGGEVDLPETPRKIIPETIEFQDLPPAHEKKGMLEVFKKGVVDFFEVDSPEVLEMMEDLNRELALMLLEDQVFKRELEEALYLNADILTTSSLYLEGKPVPGTASNWLKDFLKKSGTSFFDNVVLSGYVANSENAKKLADHDKNKLAKLLTLYRNIKFFPGSMGNVPPDNWQVIPLGRPRAEEKNVSAMPSKKIASNPLKNYDLKNMTPLEISALQEQYDISDEEIEKMKK